ncbi:hypothetical protein ACJ8PQ_22750, partial [Serratia sp. CY74664]|uniref:hypothetical protein n=1 Tax=Serratia sp. CY74664 TaxID=3383676 RepID=UPI003FA0E10B
PGVSITRGLRSLTGQDDLTHALRDLQQARLAPQTCSRLQILFLTIGRESGYQQGRKQKKSHHKPQKKTNENSGVNNRRGKAGLVRKGIN